jgi:hypothetical protein
VTDNGSWALLVKVGEGTAHNIGTPRRPVVSSDNQAIASLA